MKELLLVLIPSLITGVFTYLGVRKNSSVQIANLENQLKLKEKDIEQLKIQHELDLKSKEADVMNPIMGKFFEEIIEDPSKITKLMSLQSQVEKLKK